MRELNKSELNIVVGGGWARDAGVFVGETMRSIGDSLESSAYEAIDWWLDLNNID
ncbi:hypothetical protein [Pseudoalteromonas sp. SG43-3]|uniref:hypothetical protein n=1 Tax=Pseudoalteromonas sp. SG43-3 TaxID=2760970 RepID=UPI001603287A|nr:hypothetical protein [Pseudoalteromonas sp. SG43-3]MBB1442879.1 hypothetical protein [Pseudoalteromonas sp. SG43-3]